MVAASWERTNVSDDACPREASGVATVLRVTSGNFLEMFDFFLFGFYATYISKAFFPTGSEFASLMLTFMTFGAGFLMRPLGAIILGAYVDQIGRRKGLILTLAIMASGTILIAFVPGYATIGLLAPALVLVGRLLQGFSAGVELGGVSVYLSEMATPGQQGLLRRLAVGQPAGGDHGRRAHRLPAEHAADAAADRRLGLAHPVLHRLPDRAVPVLHPPLAGGDAGVPGAQAPALDCRRSSPRSARTGRSCCWA